MGEIGQRRGSAWKGTDGVVLKSSGGSSEKLTVFEEKGGLVGGIGCEVCEKNREERQIFLGPMVQTAGGKWSWSLGAQSKIGDGAGFAGGRMEGPLLVAMAQLTARQKVRPGKKDQRLLRQKWMDFRACKVQKQSSLQDWVCKCLLPNAVMQTDKKESCPGTTHSW